MEVPLSSTKDGEKKRNRFMGKLFKEKKEEIVSQNDVDDFLHGPSDKLHMVGTEPPAPQPVKRVDTATARRWPTASEVTTLKDTGGRSASPKRSRKGLMVKFCEEQPEVIGEGGDEATSPTADIGIRRRAHTHPPAHQPKSEQHATGERDTQAPGYGAEIAERAGNMDFRPGPVRRTQTGFQSIPDAKPSFEAGSEQSAYPGEHSLQVLSNRSEGDRQSFADMVKADMRSGEGKALLRSSSQASDELFTGAESAGVSVPSQQLEELQLNTIQNTHIPPSPGFPHSPIPNEPRNDEHTTERPGGSRASTSSVPRSLQPAVPVSENDLVESPVTLSRTPTFTIQEAALAVGDDALREFSRRVANLYTLFRLSTEASKPLTKCSLEELVRVGLWWFLKGRMNLEATIREASKREATNRPCTPQAQQATEFTRAQAFADLGKALWIMETVTTQYPETQLRPGTVDPKTPLGDILDTRQLVLSSLKKLTMSMKRNNHFPPDPEDAPLRQGIDHSIWVGGEGSQSLLSGQRLQSVGTLSEAFPVGDTSRTFYFVRMFVDSRLVEDAAAQEYRCPVLVSIVRGQKESSATAIISSQDGSLNLSIQNDKNRGITWNDVRWRTSQRVVEISLPRGFVLQLSCSEQDFRTLWGMHDYEKRTQAVMVQRQGEEVVFETILQSFQHYDSNPQSSFTKEPQPDCHLRLFEKTVVVKAATGPRTMHRGFRLGLNTSTKTKNFRCIDQDFLPSQPLQFGFLRGDGGLAAMSLKIDDEKARYTVVCTFRDPSERTRLHTLLTAIALGDGEDVVAEAPMRGFTLANSDGELDCLKSLAWQNYRVINHDHGDLQNNKTVLSESLRVIIDFKGGNLLDRVNVEPGELKVRLDVNNMKELKVLRQAQEDMTFSISDSQVSKTLPGELTALLDTISKSDSTRTYTFPSQQELHLFQAALTGFVVVFDGIASSFNIARRRMVVPIYKKWDAAKTRVQIIQREKVVQLVAFFENFSHGRAMNFTLKSTDVFETSGSKKAFSLKIVDAKFALPKFQKGSEGGVDHEFVCLDMPEYPGEHDDVTIVFDVENDRDHFAKALPSPAKVASRLGSVRR